LVALDAITDMTDNDEYVFCCCLVSILDVKSYSQ